MIQHIRYMELGVSWNPRDMTLHLLRSPHGLTLCGKKVLIVVGGVGNVNLCPACVRVKNRKRRK